jgi:hypothetical protein
MHEDVTRGPNEHYAAIQRRLGVARNWHGSDDNVATGDLGKEQDLAARWREEQECE